MKIIRTKNIEILKTWLSGGQINEYGNTTDGFNCFNIYFYDYVKNNLIDYEKIKEDIENLILDYGDDKFYYYGQYYKFKIPQEHNLKFLVNEIARQLNHILENEQ